MSKKSQKRLLSLGLALMLLLPLISVPAMATEEADVPTGEFDGYIVKLQEGSRSELLGLETGDVSAGGTDPFDMPAGVEALDCADGYYLADTLEAAEALADCVDVEYIEPNYIIHLYDEDMLGVVSGQPDKEINSVHLNTMNAGALRDYGITGEDLDTATDMGGDGNYTDQIVIAVIDSGLDTDHEDIDYTHVLKGANFVQSNSSSTADTSGHGTFVTGEILATLDNDLGIDGIASGVYVMPLKVFASDSTTNSVVISAINYATQQKELFDSSNGTDGNNICVINMSLGSESYSEAMKAAVDGAIEAGIIVICAAGNDGDTTASYPAQYAIGVGSTDADGGLDNYAGTYTQVLSSENGSGWKNKVWVSAPGTYYTSLWYNGGYYTGSGTSFSSPQVAALAAIALSLNNDLTTCYQAGATVDNGEGSQVSVDSNHNAFKKLLQETANLTDYNSAETTKYNSGNTLTDDGQDIRYGWGVADFDAMVTKLAGERSGNTALTFNVANAAGTTLTAEKNGLSITIYPYDDSGEPGTALTPDGDGVYTLARGTRYHYIVSANKYITSESDFVAILPARTLNIVLEGKDYRVDFKVTNTDGKTVPDPVITLTRESGAEVDQNTDDDSFTVKNGAYTYTVSAKGYFPYGGSFVINDEENEYENDRYAETVTLLGAQDICSVTFNVRGSDGEPYGEVTLTDSSGNKVEPYIDGAWKLDPGEYSYVVESDYYQPVSGVLTIAEEDKGTSRDETVLMDARLYWAFIDVLPLSVAELDSTAIEVKDANGTVVNAFHNVKGEYRIINGEYTYVVKAEGYKTATGSFTMAGKVIYIDVEMEEGTDVDDPGDGADIDDPGDGGSGSGGTSIGGSGGGSEVTAPNEGDETGKIVTGPETGKYADVVTEYHELDDVTPGDWFYEPVNFTMTVGLFQGSTPTLFRPYTDMTRAMLVTVLYRLSGGEAPETGYRFADVPADAYYADAVAWASENGIVKGVSETSFAPDQAVTREQIVVLLCRYAQWAGFDTTVMGDGAALAFADYDKVSAYAVNEVGWAYERDLVQGDQAGLFDPLAGATRAETATILMRFLKNVL